MSYLAQGGQFGGGCLDNTVEPGLDVRLTGTIDVLDNGTGYNSTDGTCSGGVNQIVTFVAAADLTGADGKCASIGANSAVFRLVDRGWLTAPADWWICLRLILPT